MVVFHCPRARAAAAWTSRDVNPVSYSHVYMRMVVDVFAIDLRQTLRDLQRSPGLTLAIVATLALGVGVNAAMFTVLDRIVWRQPDGVRDAGEVHRLYKAGRGSQTPISYSDWFSAPELDAI